MGLSCSAVVPSLHLNFLVTCLECCRLIQFDVSLQRRTTTPGRLSRRAIAAVRPATIGTLRRTPRTLRTRLRHTAANRTDRRMDGAARRADTTHRRTITSRSTSTRRGHHRSRRPRPIPAALVVPRGARPLRCPCPRPYPYSPLPPPRYSPHRPSTATRTTSRTSTCRWSTTTRASR